MVLITQFVKGVLLGIMLTLCACADTPQAFDPDVIKTEITHMLLEQDAAWNAQDLDAFIGYYLKSDELQMVARGQLLHGWDALHANFYERHIERGEMGVLSFSDVEIKPLSAEYAYVFARWQVDNTSKSRDGFFTTLMKKVNGKWYISAEHMTQN